MTTTAMDVTIYANGTVRTIPTRYVGHKDGTVTIHWQDGRTETHPDETSARAAYDWTGLIFTQEHLDYKALVEASQPPALWINGRYQSEPHPFLDGYTAAVADGDFNTAAREIEQFFVRQGYGQYDGSWTKESERLMVVRMKRQIVTKSGRVLVRGDVALARVRKTDDPCSGSDVTVFSVRKLTNIGCSMSDVTVIAER